MIYTNALPSTEKGTLSYLHTDHLSSNNLATSSSGTQTASRTYYAYGTEQPGDTGTLPTDRTFTGQKADSTGLMYFNARYYDTNTNYLYIVGEVVNLTGNNVQYIRITADVYNHQQLADTDYTYTASSVLAPGDRGCFKIIFLSIPTSWTHYTLSGSYQSGGTFAPNLTLFNDSSSINQFGWYEIVGQVRNDGDQKASYVRVVSTLFDEDGTVIDCDYTFVNSTDLEPGQTSSFKTIPLGRESYSEVESYKLQVQGQLP